ncbi:MAG: hypothetical protein P1V97_28445 [Planctomycetota bacterium]|nr:hypothetical protein [Planctomycetota bacterium]
MLSSRLPIASTLLALLLSSTTVSAQDLSGRWKVQGSNSKGAYKGLLTVQGPRAPLKLSYEAKAADGTKIRLLGKLGASSNQVSIVATKLKGRAAPKTGEVKDFLHFGDVVKVLKSADGWLQVNHNGKELWISERWTKPVVATSKTLKFTMTLPRGLASRLGEGLGEGEESNTGTYKGEFTWINKDRLDGTLKGPAGDVRVESWRRVPRGSRFGSTRFVLKGTSRPISDTVIILANRSGGLLKSKFTIKTNASGIAALPEELPSTGEYEVFFIRRKEDFSKRPKSKTDLVKVSDLKGEDDKEVGLRYFGPRWKTEYEHMLTVKDIVGSGGFRWNKEKGEWVTPILDCITSAFYAVAAAADLGVRGIYKPPSVDNMLRDKRGRPMVVNSCFKNLLKPVWGSNDTMARLATSGSVYRGVCRWPWKSMRWGWTEENDCGCGAHVTPATIMNNPEKLGRINILSMSQAKRPKGPDYGPMSGWTMRYEYSVLVLIKRDDGSLYCYHASSSHNERKRCKTFKDEVEYWGVDSYGSKQTDVRYLVWKADDSQIDPFFWLDENGNEFTPKHILEDLKKQAGQPGSTYPKPPVIEADPESTPESNPEAEGDSEEESESGSDDE